MPRNLVFLLPLIFCACMLTKPSSAPAPSSQQATAPDQIWFLTFRMTHDSVSNTNQLQLLNKSVGPGKMKAQLEQLPSLKHSSLVVEILEQNTIVKEFQLEHPLNKLVEFVSQDSLQSRELHLKTADFFFRVQQHGKPLTIRISELLPEQTNRELINLQLP